MQQLCRTLIVAVFLVGPGMALGQVKAEDLVGKWVGTLETQRGASERTITFSLNDDGELTGESTSSRGSGEITSVTLGEDGALAFSRTSSFGGGDFVISFKGKLEGDAISGEYDFDGRFSAPFTAKRVAASANVVGQTKPGDLVGKWDGSTVSDRGTFTSTITFSLENDALVGSYTSERGGDRSLKDIVLKEDGALTYTITFSRQGNEFVLTFNGKLDGDAITGEFDFDGRGSSSYTARRVKSDS